MSHLWSYIRPPRDVPFRIWPQRLAGRTHANVEQKLKMTLSIQSPPRIFWDEFSRKLFDPSSVSVELYGLPDDFNITSRDVISLTGAPRDSFVKCSGVGRAVMVTVMNETYFEDPMQFSLIRAPSGGWEAMLQFIKLRREHRGNRNAARIFYSMARSAHRLSVHRLYSQALHVDASESSGGEQWSGVHAAMALGWDGDLPENVRHALPAGLSTLTTAQQLLQSAEGKAWWQENPASLKLFFDTAPKSESMVRLSTYTKDRGIRPSQ